MPAIKPEVLARARDVLEQVREEWLQRPGVTAVDLGFKWEQGQMTAQLSLRAHVQRKKPAAELSEAELFPKEVDGIPVDVIEATYQPQHLLDAQLHAAVEERGRRFTEMPLGVSIGTRHTTAGTLGAKVIDEQDGAEMILTNWHVVGGSPDGEPDLPLWQPGRIDGGGQDDTVAVVVRSIIGPFDAAVARLTGSRPLKNETIEGHPIDQPATPSLGMMVWKSGRTTGYTEGFIDGISMQLTLTYPTAGPRTLRQVFRVVPRPGAVAVEVSEPGDSGAVWVDENTGKAVGLHFAGEAKDQPEFALAHDMMAALRACQVRLPGQPGDEPKPPIFSDPPYNPPKRPGRAINGPAQEGFWRQLFSRLLRLFGLDK